MRAPFVGVMVIQSPFHRSCSRAFALGEAGWKILLLLLGLTASLAAQPKEKVIVVSWGDLVGDPRFSGVAQLDTPERVQTAARLWKERGVDKVLFRVDDLRLLRFHELFLPESNKLYQDWVAAVRRAEKTDLFPNAARLIKAAGVEVYMWISVIDEGAEPGVFYDDIEPFPWQCRFVHAHPEYQSCDRSTTFSGRKYHQGVLEFAYPEVRAHVLEEIRSFSDTMPFDGVFLSFRSHSPPPEHADQFGFNKPIVDEYRRRYGKDILRQDFDLEKWRSLRGEYFTTFLRDVRAHLNMRGQKLSLGVPQGEHAGPPIGNMELQWRTWVKEKLVDELVVGHHTLQRATYHNRWQRTWGYVQDQDEGIGLPTLDVSIQRDYGPLCHEHGVRLYVDLPLGNFHRTYSDPTLGKGIEKPEDLAAIMQRLEKLPLLDGIVVDGRPYSVPAPQ